MTRLLVTMAGGFCALNVLRNTSLCRCMRGLLCVARWSKWHPQWYGLLANDGLVKSRRGSGTISGASSQRGLDCCCRHVDFCAVLYGSGSRTVFCMMCIVCLMLEYERATMMKPTAAITAKPYLLVAQCVEY